MVHKHTCRGGTKAYKHTSRLRRLPAHIKGLCCKPQSQACTTRFQASTGNQNAGGACAVRAGLRGAMQSWCLTEFKAEFRNCACIPLVRMQVCDCCMYVKSGFSSFKTVHPTLCSRTHHLSGKTGNLRPGLCWSCHTGWISQCRSSGASWTARPSKLLWTV